MTSEQVVAFFTQSKIKSLVYEGHNDRKKKDMNENNFVLWQKVNRKRSANILLDLTLIIFYLLYAYFVFFQSLIFYRVNNLRIKKCVCFYKRTFNRYRGSINQCNIDFKCAISSWPDVWFSVNR